MFRIVHRLLVITTNPIFQCSSRSSVGSSFSSALQVSRDLRYPLSSVSRAEGGLPASSKVSSEFHPSVCLWAPLDLTLETQPGITKGQLDFHSHGAYAGSVGRSENWAVNTKRCTWRTTSKDQPELANQWTGTVLAILERKKGTNKVATRSVRHPLLTYLKTSLQTYHQPKWVNLQNKRNR